jgi:hypothetical protein
MIEGSVAADPAWRPITLSDKTDRTDRRFCDLIELVMIAGQDSAILQECESKGDAIGQRKSAATLL